MIAAVYQLEFGYSYACVALTMLGKVEFLYRRVRFEIRVDAWAKRPCPFSVNYADR